MLRRLHPEQPDSFAFTDANQKWAEAQISKYPEGRQASAIIALLWRAQEQEGWLTRPAIEHVAGMLDMAYIRALEVATFYFMFQLAPVGSVAHVQVCGTTSCMICGAEDLIAVCKDKIAKRAHELSADGKFSWEEVECLGACANAPMAQIGKDYYEDLTAESFGKLLDDMAAGKVPQPGSQAGRFSSEPLDGKTVLEKERVNETNASVALAMDLGDTLKRIDGTELPIRAPWNPIMDNPGAVPPKQRDDLLPPDAPIKGDTPGPQPSKDTPVSDKGVAKQKSEGEEKGRPDEGSVAGTQAEDDHKPMTGGNRPAGSINGKPAQDDREGSTHSGSGPLSGSGDEGKPAGGPGSSGALHVPGSDDASDVAEGSEIEPTGLDAPRGGEADDLKAINGVGPKLEETLHGMGIYHFDQIAAWTAQELAWIDRNLEGFKGRAIRDDWVGQARDLARGGKTED